MRTYLPQNQFVSNSDVLVPETSGSAGAKLLPPSEAPAEANQVSDGVLVSSLTKMEPTLAHTPSETEGAVSRSASSDIHEIFRVARLLCAAQQFVPDYEGILFAMQDETAPRLRADDPVWADEAPLFLQSNG